MHSIRRPSAAVTTGAQVAGLLTAVAAAKGRVAVEADRLAGSRAAVSLTTIDPLTHPADDLRLAAHARLAQLDPELLLAATSVWLSRRHAQRASGASTSAASRAVVSWGGATA